MIRPRIRKDLKTVYCLMLSLYVRTHADVGRLPEWFEHQHQCRTRVSRRWKSLPLTTPIVLRICIGYIYCIHGVILGTFHLKKVSWALDTAVRYQFKLEIKWIKMQNKFIDFKLNSERWSDANGYQERERESLWQLWTFVCSVFSFFILHAF